MKWQITGNTLSWSSLKKKIHRIDWKLLLFLLLFLNVKLVVKIAAVCVIYLLRPDMRFGLRWKNSRLPLFYPLVIAIAIINALLYKSFFSLPNTLTVLVGIGFWVLCFAALHQVKLSVEKNDPHVLNNTIVCFFAINILFSLVNITSIIWEIGDINPYRYQGNYQKYFISTGDYIRGVSFDTSTTNAVINAFAVVYFLSREKLVWMVLAMIVLLLTASNFTSLILLGSFVVLFIFSSNANQKSMMVICTVMLVVFLTKISPQNDEYVANGVHDFLFHKKAVVHSSVAELPLAQRSDSTLSADEKMQKTAQLYLDSLDRLEVKEQAVVVQTAAIIKPEIPAPSIHSVPYQRRHDTSLLQLSLRQFAHTEQLTLLPVQPTPARKLFPGKLTAMLQTVDFLKAHPLKIINGNGIGNFSSKLAFRSTALKIAGGYPLRYRYIHDDFKKNHLTIFLSYFIGDKETHSIINTPNSTYIQLLSEYGLLGLAAFFMFYLKYFLSGYKRLTYGIPVLLIMCGMFFVDYWFEQLSVVVIFELLLLLNMQEQRVIKIQHE